MTMKAIITRHRADNSIIGEPEMRENLTPDDFDKIAAELDAECADPTDELVTYQLVGA